MPMVVVGREKNFSQLQARLFAGRVSGKVAKEVAAAVAAANPDVDLDHLDPGTVLRVPDLPSVSLPGEVALDDSAAETIEAVSGAATEALGALVNGAAVREKTAAAQRKRLAAALGSDEVTRAAEQDEKLAADVASARTMLEEEDGTAEQRMARLEQAQAEWSAGLEALMNPGR